MWLLWFILTLVILKLYNKWSIRKCYSRNVMRGKVVIVTGANSGVGYETALDLARRGAKVILTCRDHQKGQKAVSSIIKATANKNVRYEHLDLSSLASVRKFVDIFKECEAKLDVLINNATAYGKDRRKTEDGIIKDMQVNHFGPFLLTVLLVPWLKKGFPSRVVMVSSTVHRFGTIDGINEDSYGTLRTYANSKLCNVLFSNILADRLQGAGVVVNSADPGIVDTFTPKILGKFGSLILYPFMKTPKEGAQTLIYLAVSDECDQVTGRYFVDCAKSTMSLKAKDETLMKKLWSMSNELVNLKEEETV